jgi:hypothetical protein
MPSPAETMAKPRKPITAAARMRGTPKSNSSDKSAETTIAATMIPVAKLWRATRPVDVHEGVTNVGIRSSTSGVVGIVIIPMSDSS